jgi:tRNA1(Val) A37 N6-methylase TrmN6
MTAYVAAKQVEQQQQHTSSSNNDNNNKLVYKYLDLGTGNGSVLTMTTWKLLQLLQDDNTSTGGSTSSSTAHTFCDDNDKSQNKPVVLQCVGIEARKEAVDLNRRSLSYNVGYDLLLDDVDKNGTAIPPRHQQQQQLPDDDYTSRCQVQVQAKVMHGDFRELEQLLQQPIWKSSTATAATTNTTTHDLRGQFDLITGTPPYFRVDFQVSSKSTEDDDSSSPLSTSNVQHAIIQQGGMPSCRQSAPARCEFRGGIEAYCSAAALALAPDGIFCVCENWANHARVLQAAFSAQLVLVEIHPVKGSVTKPEPLFAVYVMRKPSAAAAAAAAAASLDDHPFDDQTTTTTTTTEMRMLPPISVRDDKGQWTVDYATKVLEYMGIPARHNINPKNRQV